MASTTIIKYPDGRTEQKNVLCNFIKNGTDVIVFETEKVDNNHKVVGVSYLDNGMYQNVVDANKWNEVKSYLVDILHDRIVSDDYKIVPEEVLVTEDPYHPLGLREENYDKIVASYEQFKNNIAAVNQEQNVNTPVAPEAPVVEEPVKPVENEIIQEAPVETPTIVEQPVLESAPTEVVAEEKVIDPFAIADSLEANATPSEVHQDIVPPVGVDIVSDAPAITETVNDPSTTIEENNNIETPATFDFNNLINEEPVVEASPAPVESPVQENYENRTAEIIAQMRELSENYLKKMEEMSAEISRNLEEAKGINELAKQTLDKAQTVVPITEDSLELTRAA
jgi:hypothetical protein